MLVPEALEKLKHHWDLIPEDKRDCFAGVEGLCAHMENGRIAGTLYPDDTLDSNYIDIRKRYNVGGDKKNSVRTDLLRKFPFPQFPGEKHIRPSLLWKRLSADYKFRYINEVIQLIEYQPDGLSSDRFPLRMRNPQGFRYYFKEDINLRSEKYNLSDRFDNSVKYVRFSFHCGIGPLGQYHEINDRMLWAISLPKGFLDWARDRLRMRISGGSTK
jgi:hypothetical protein